MAVTEQTKNVTARPVLNDGIDSSGNQATVNGSFGSTLNPTVFTGDGASSANQKLLNIAHALNDCLSLAVYSVTKTTTVTLEEE